MSNCAVIDQALLARELDRLIRRAVVNISADTRQLLEEALERETKPTARGMLQSMLENTRMAREGNMPVCQSPGYPTVYVRFGDACLPGKLADMLGAGVVQATAEGLLRPSIVHPLTRKNSGDNSGEGVPNYEWSYEPALDYLEIIASLKGCGAELGNAMRIMTVPQLGKQNRGLKNFVLDTVIEAGGKPCPPVGIGIGIGGQMDVAAKLSRKAISTRLWTDNHPDPLYRQLEEELLQEINALGLGAAGVGGETYALAVKIGAAATHTAIAPVAINFHCWVTRRGGVRIWPDGRVEDLF